MSIRIFIVDDHPIMRRGYRSIISVESDLEICGEASDAREALEAIPLLQPDVVLVDISLDGMSGLELIKHLVVLCPGLPLLVVSMHSETLYAERALHAGAVGYIMKSEVETAVIRAIRIACKGGLYLSDSMNTRILKQFTRRVEEQELTPIERLGDRELEVFEHIGKGLSTQQIAEVMRISPKTVESHRTRIKAKLSIESTSELRQRAVLWIHDAKEA